MTGRRITALAVATMCVAGLTACQTSNTGGTGGGSPDNPASISYEPRPVETYVANRAACDATFRPLLTADQAVHRRRIESEVSGQLTLRTLGPLEGQLEPGMCLHCVFAFHGRILRKTQQHCQ